MSNKYVFKQFFNVFSVSIGLWKSLEVGGVGYFYNFYTMRSRSIAGNVGISMHIVEFKTQTFQVNF